MADSSHAVLDTFRRFDEDGDGTIGRQELARVLRGLDSRWVDEEIFSLCDGADTDHDGRIKLRVFLAWIFGDAAVDSAFDGQSAGVVENLQLAEETEFVQVVASQVVEETALPSDVGEEPADTAEIVEDTELVILESSISGDYSEVSARKPADRAIQALLDSPGIRSACEEQPWTTSGALPRLKFATWRAVSYTTTMQLAAGSKSKYAITVAISEAGIQADGSQEQELLELELMVFKDFGNSSARPPEFLGASMPMTVLEDAPCLDNMGVDIEENYMDRSGYKSRTDP